MRKFLAVLLVFSFTAYVPLTECAARAADFPAPAALPAASNTATPVRASVSYGASARIAALRFAPLQSQDESFQLFAPEQLENLLAPIALYPDPLLSQVLLAATFPDQIDEADRELHANYDHYDVDNGPWDVSVRAVAHYPTVLHMMAEKLDWTTSLGQAYVNQSTDVMEAVQRLRRRSREAGYLVSSPQMEVVETDGYIYCWPAQPRYIYVPVYNPALVFLPRRGFFVGAAVGFSVGFVIGAWLNHDCDWREHRVFYHGWDRDEGWVRRSRPFVQVNNIYVNRTYVNVTVNRTVVRNEVNYRALDRYNYVHRDVHYDDVRDRHVELGRRQGWGDRSGDRGQPRDDRGSDRGRSDRPSNKIIDRNINTHDPRIDVYRGHVPVTPMPQRGEDVRTDRRGQIPTTPMPQRGEDVRTDRRGQIPTTPMPQRGEDARPGKGRTAPVQPQPSRPTVQPSPRGVDRPNTSVYGGSRGPIDPGAASRRGQNSRVEMSKPPSSPPPPRGGGGGGGRPSGGEKPRGGRSK